MRHGKIDINSILKDDKFDFSAHTTYGLGGRAKAAYFPATEEEAATVFSYLTKKSVKFVILGNGSNVLASDKYFDGAVISTKNLSGITVSGNSLHCLAGTTVSELLRFCKENGLSGPEYLAGIPASIGGLAYMNGGTASRHIENDIQDIRVFDGSFHDFCAKNCNFGNKHSTMRDINCLITSVDLSFEYSTCEKVGQNIENYLALRRSQPKGKSCGCVFKNPAGLSAGKLIDELGLKGLSYGGAQVSDAHANFIINANARAEDVYTLIKEVKRRVYAYYGVMLEEEVIYIGEFNDFNC